MASTIRTFIAIDLPLAIKDELNSLISKLRHELEDHSIRWVKSDSIHLTLKFIGDIDISSVSNITSAMNQVAARHENFDIRISNLGCFPKPSRPRVIWVGVQEGSGRLSNLQKDIEIVLAELGIEKEGRPYHAHLTLGRVKESRNLEDIFKKFEVGHIQDVSVNSFKFIKSELTPTGARYSDLGTFSLHQDG